MGARFLMFDFGREWWGVEGASAAALQDLKSITEGKLPASYYDFLRCSNGGEGSLPVLPFNCCFDSAETVTVNVRDRSFEECFPGFVVFGGSGGGEFLAFDVRATPPWPIVAIDMCNSDLTESVELVATDFAKFVKLLGIPKD